MTQSRETQALANDYKDQYTKNLETANTYAQMAREQTNMLKTIQDELTTQIKVQIDLKKQLDERLVDDSEVLLYSVTSRDALNRVQKELFGNGVISHKTYNAVTQRLKI